MKTKPIHSYKNKVLLIALFFKLMIEWHKIRRKSTATRLLKDWFSPPCRKTISLNQEDERLLFFKKLLNVSSRLKNIFYTKVYTKKSKIVAALLLQQWRNDWKRLPNKISHFFFAYSYSQKSKNSLKHFHTESKKDYTEQCTA